MKSLWVWRTCQVSHISPSGDKQDVLLFPIVLGEPVHTSASLTNSVNASFILEVHAPQCSGPSRQLDAGRVFVLSPGWGAAPRPGGAVSGAAAARPDTCSEFVPAEGGEAGDSLNHDVGVEAAPAGRKESVEVPVCCFLSRTGRRMHGQMVRNCLNTVISLMNDIWRVLVGRQRCSANANVTPS